MRFCKKCGMELTGRGKFCRGCGTLIENEGLDGIDKEDIIEAQQIEKQETVEVEQRENGIENQQVEIEKATESMQVEVEEAIEAEQVEINNSIEEDRNENISLNITKEEVKEEVREEAREEAREEVNIKTSAIKENKTKAEGPKKKINKKLLIGLVALLAIALTGGFLLLKSDSPIEVIEKFKTAVESEDVEKLKGILISEDSSLELNDANIKVLIAGYKGERFTLTQDLEALKGQAKEIEKPDYIEQEFINVCLVKEKKGLKTKYSIKLKPKYIKLTKKINEAKYELKSGEEKIECDFSTDQIGPLVPGRYTLNGEFKNEHGEGTDSAALFLLGVEEICEVNFFKDVINVDITTNEEEALLIIDGKNTNKKLKDVKNIIGLKRGTVIQGTIEKEGKVRTSPKYSVNESGNIYIEVEAEKVINHLDYTNDVPKLIEDYLRAFASAVNSNDFGYIKDYLYPGSQIYKEQIKNIDSFSKNEIHENYIAHYIDSTTFDEEKKEWTVKVNETYDITLKDKEERKTFNNEYKIKVNEDNEKLQLTTVKVKK